MATGYEVSRFVKPVDQSLHCVICKEVLRDPVQCCRNGHHFCRNCITENRRYSPNCPTCKDPVETLARPQRFLANTLSSLKISCENSERGCPKIVELGSLDTHVATCGFSPMPCSNDQCDEIISQRDKEIHENKVCGFRRVECDYCAQMVLHKNFMEHLCTHTCEMKAELREVRSTQDEMFNMMQNMMSSLTRLERNTAQRSEGSHASSGQELKAEIVVAGGSFCKSVEVFDMATKTWRPLSEMNECRDEASSVLYQGHMFVTGGDFGYLHLPDSVEVLNLAEQDGHWVKSQFKLPVPSCGHACVVYQSHVFLIGGHVSSKPCDTIHEIQLTPPYASRLLTKMSTPIRDHGAEIVNGKIYIIGGRTAGRCEDATNTVLKFDPATNTCTELKPLPHPVSSMATATWKDNVIVLGGRDNQGNILNTVILYNVITGSRRMLPEMTNKRYGCIAVVIDDNIITMGGCDETHTELNSVECYNFQTNIWTEFPAMAEARVFATAVVKYC
ncbi:E3 ubiquitin- ligase NRDP1 [Paramuricea clavata]|uniref:E3 ubiquitin- ligase NRDP1, partial n=1 Tax=Paramuricea clavata TaxID=317549 RepID=A0A6S7LQ35_PARCT|nr:E3 ubiquitin- ligase NRDP1 [Paramuricea clavata]